MIDLWQEIYGTVRRNKLRTVLTGCAVAWGIFILIVLLGAGNGLLNAQNEQMSSLAMNSLQIGAGWTSKPYDGLKQGRRIQLNNGDLEISSRMKEHVITAGAILYQGNTNISFGAEYINESLRGVHPNYLEINRPKIVEGRFINALDIQESRKVAVIHKLSAEILFKQPEQALGKMLNIGGIMYQVIGIYQDLGNSYERSVFLPFSTLQLIYNKGDKLAHQ